MRNKKGLKPNGRQQKIPGLLQFIPSLRIREQYVTGNYSKIIIKILIQGLDNFIGLFCGM